MIERYMHHGVDVAVISALKGKHREHCLCYHGCQHFKPGQIDNCLIAQETFANCVRHDLCTPVFECPRFAQAGVPFDP